MAIAQDLSGTLNELIQTCIDGQNGFDTAAKAIDDASLKSELAGYSAQRRDFAAELKALVARTGETPTDSGSVAAALHRGWINLKNAVATNDRRAILAECERGEDSAVAEYRKAIAADLPVEFATVVQRQYAAVQRTHDRIKALRDSAKAS